MNSKEFHFSPPPQTIAYWQRVGIRPIQDFEIILLERRFNAKLPESYLAFMTKFGSTEFGYDTANEFSYECGRCQYASQIVGHIKSVERVLRYYDGLKNDKDLDFQENLLPFAMDLSQGELFIEVGESTQRIFYWDFDAHDWSDKNMNLCFVASNMYDFINSLKYSS